MAWQQTKVEIENMFADFIAVPNRFVWNSKTIDGVNYDLIQLKYKVLKLGPAFST